MRTAVARLHARLPERRLLRYLVWSILVALTLSALSVVLDWRLKTQTGLTRIVFRSPDFTGVLKQEIARNVDLRFLGQDPHLPRRFVSVRWTGVWHIPREGVYTLYVGGDDRLVLTIDGNVVAERDATVGFRTVSRALSLHAGFHALEVDYQQYSGASFLTVLWAPPGETPRPFGVESLFPREPNPAGLRVNARLSTLRRGLLALWLAILGSLVLAGVSDLARSVRSHPDGWKRALSRSAATLRDAAPLAGRIGQTLVPALPVLVVLYAGALRFDALVRKYGPIERPPWVYELQVHARDRVSRLRPQSFNWAREAHPYVGGDPVNYIRFAREMTHFYAAHVREPLFVFVTKLFLRILDRQDVAVSFASGLFSTLLVLATYLLGSYAFSRPVGLAAALAIAIEREVIAWGVDGWRDDAFAFSVVLSAYALLRCYRSASLGNAVFAGLVGGAACLTRITAVSFLLPGFAYLVFAGKERPLTDRLIKVGISVLVLAAVTAPYLINCAIVYGDPLYAINYHTRFYLSREGLPAHRSLGALEYLKSKVLSGPLDSLGTVVAGLTAYPFLNKWNGFGGWLPGLGRALCWSAVPGLLLFAWSGTGRLLLFLLMTSLIPYAFTWQIRGGGEWRFTLHAYPFYLIASCVALSRAATLVARRAGLRTEGRGLK